MGRQGLEAERLRAEKALQESEARYRSLVETSPDSITMSDLEGRILLCSQQTARMHGFERPEDLLGRNVLEFIAPEDHQRANENIQKTLEKDAVLGIEYRLLRKDGSSFPGEISASLIRNANGEPEAFIGVIRDITERRRTEEWMRRYTAQAEGLARAAARLNARLDLGTVLTVICEEAAGGVNVPAAAVRLYDSQQEEFYCSASFGIAWEEFSRFPPFPRALFGDTLLEHGLPLVIPDLQAIQDLPGGEVYREHDIRTAAYTPLTYKGQLLGVLSVLAVGQRRNFDELELAFLKALAGQGAAAIANARLFAETERQAHRLQSINDITRAALESADLESVLQSLAERLRELLGADNVFITLWDEDRQLPRMAPIHRDLLERFPLARPLPGEATMTQAVLQAGRALIAEEVLNSPYISPRIAATFPARSLIGLPLMVGETRLGAALATYNTPHRFTPGEIDEWGEVASQVSLAVAKALLLDSERQRRQEAETLAIENARLFEQTRQRADELEALARVSSALRQARVFDEILPILIQETVEVTGAGDGLLFLVQESLSGKNELVFAAAHGPGLLATGLPRVLNRSQLWQAIRKGELLWISDRDELQCLISPHSDPAILRGIASAAIVPLETAEAPIGLLVLAFSDPGDLPLEKQRLLVAIAEMAGNSLHRARLVETLEQRVLVRTRELATLYDVAAVTSEFIDLQSLLEQALEKVLAAMESEVGALHLLDESQATLYLAVQRGMGAEAARAVESVPLEGNLWGWVIEHSRPTIIPNIGADERVSAVLRAEPVHTYLGVPVRSKGKAVGVLSIFGKNIQPYNVEEIALLDAIGDQIGVAVESARLRKRAEEAAMMHERQRLARELHDAVTQSLYSLNLFAEASQMALESGNLEAVGTWLKEIGQTAHQSLKEMRLLLYELRPSTLNQDGLVGALRRRLEAVEGRSGVQARLLVDGEVRLPPAAAEELYRLAQEALNNVLKHASATAVTVNILTRENRLALEVVDNGSGFDPSSLNLESGSGGMGLANMEERARRLGGQLALHSEAGNGTRVKVEVEVRDE